MKRETFFLKFAVVLMGLPVLALCIFLLPGIAEYFAELNPKLDFLQYPFLIGLYVTAIVFFVALYQALKLLSYIDKNQAFSELSVKSLKNIKYCAITIGALYVVFMPLLYLMAEVDDTPGIILIGMVIIFGCMVVAVFASILQKLLKNAIDIKSENDLTI
jgi:predicted lysophospholipase L1 biosynthesis ABC-type transport system permease subunit